MPDPIFMRRHQSRPRPDERPAFPLDMDAFRACRTGDDQAQQAFALGVAWWQEANSGLFRSWDDLAFLRADWDGPTVLML